MSRLAELDGADARPFPHIPALDGVRCLAIVLVMLLHFSGPWRGETEMFSGGYIGVDVFFVLSGFLITSLLANEQARNNVVSYTAFYARRGLRLLPALGFLLVGHAIFIWQTTGKMAMEVKMAAAVLLYVSNLAQVFGFKELLNSSLRFTWSLSIEEQFYLVWPAVLVGLLLRRVGTRRVLIGVLLAAAALSAISRSVAWLVHDDYVAAYLRTDARVDGLLIGAAAAFAWRWRMVPARYLDIAATLSLGLLAAATLFAGRPDDLMFTIGFTAVSLASAVIILAVAEGSWWLLPLFELAPARAIGRVAYGLYLWHPLSLRIAYRMIRYDHGRPAIVLLALALTTAFVVASWFLVEKPALRLKERFAR